MGNKLFAGGRSVQLTEHGLHDAYAEYDTVTEAELTMDRRTNRASAVAGLPPETV